MSSDYREDTGTPMEVTLKEAAQLLGLRSRSSLYRLMEDRILSPSNYLRGEVRSWRIETHPAGHRPFVEWGSIVIGPQGPRRQSDLKPSPWAHVPERLRSCDGSEPFWWSYGRIAPEEPLTDDEFWDTVARIVEGMRPDYKFTGDELAELTYWIDDARADVAAGVRWDQERWDRASVNSLLPDLPCPLTAESLRELLSAGRVPADLVPTVERALAEQEARRR